MEGDGHFLEQNNHLPLKQRDHLCTPFYSCAPVKSKSLNDAAFFNMKVKETWVHEKILVSLFQQKFQLYDSLTPPPPPPQKKKKKKIQFWIFIQLTLLRLTPVPRWLPL